MTFKKNYMDVISYLPFSLRSTLRGVASIPDSLQEIHLTAERPLMLHTASKRYYINDSLNLTENYGEELITVARDELESTFNNICNFSVYSRQNEIVNGFITLSGGNRAGICGTAVNKSGEIINIRDISSINIRIAREIKDCSAKIFNEKKEIKSTLICGEPCSGKTTVLRDIARRLSYKYRVSLIDTRMELAASVEGVPRFDVGLCDIFSAYERRRGFEQALRCMAPDFIICDEISGDDIEVLSSAKKGGARVIASLHCAGKDELINNPAFKRIISEGIFSEYVFLKSRENAGCIAEITDGDMLNV